jgi:hypothetical protein
MAQISSQPAVTQTPTTQFVGPEVQVGSADGMLGFFGTTPVAEQSVAAAASDLTTVVALANSLRTILLTYGLVK